MSEQEAGADVEARREALVEADQAAEAELSANEAGSDTLPCGLKKLSWIEIRVVDDEGEPCPGRRYRVFGEGKLVEGRVGDDGTAIVEVPVGEYAIEVAHQEASDGASEVTGPEAEAGATEDAPGGGGGGAAS